MSVISNAQFKIAENTAELLFFLQSVGVDTSAVDNSISKYEEIAEHTKLCKKRWQQQHPEKLKEYRERYKISAKWQALRKRNAEKEKTPEKRAKRKAYRERPEIRERQRAYSKEYYQRNKEHIAKRSAAFYEKNKERKNAEAREHYELNKEEIRAKSRAYYAENQERISAQRRLRYDPVKERERKRKQREKRRLTEVTE